MLPLSRQKLVFHFFFNKTRNWVLDSICFSSAPSPNYRPESDVASIYKYIENAEERDFRENTELRGL